MTDLAGRVASRLRILQADRDLARRKVAASVRLPWEPSEDGFVFSKQQVEQHAQHLMRQNAAYHAGYVRFDMTSAPGSECAPKSSPPSVLLSEIHLNGVCEESVYRPAGKAMRLRMHLTP
jgi:hypothetical protein